jgi:hypothetical protein
VAHCPYCVAFPVPISPCAGLLLPCAHGSVLHLCAFCLPPLLPSRSSSTLALVAVGGLSAPIRPPLTLPHNLLKPHRGQISLARHQAPGRARPCAGCPRQRSALPRPPGAFPYPPVTALALPSPGHAPAPPAGHPRPRSALRQPSASRPWPRFALPGPPGALPQPPITGHVPAPGVPDPGCACPDALHQPCACPCCLRWCPGVPAPPDRSRPGRCGARLQSLRQVTSRAAA